MVLPLDQRLPETARLSMARHMGAEFICTSGSGPMRKLAIDSTHTSQMSFEPLVDGDALVIATSGSTGQAKGVVHTHTSLSAHAKLVAERLNTDSSTHWWLALPAAHIGGFGAIARSLVTKCRLSTASRIDDDSIRRARNDGATHTAVVPTHLHRHRFDDWSAVLVGGAHSSALPPNAVATYGLTETGGGVVYDGKPLSAVDVSIDDGEILIKAPTMARCYRHMPLPLRDGWFNTGDLGQLENGVLHIDGRRDDLIITGGNKVWPNVVEDVLRTHPLVGDVAVRGVPDPEWGSIVCAWVVPTSSAQPPSLDDLREHAKTSLASYCAPRRVQFMSRIPRSAIGKLIVSELPLP